MDQSAGTVRFVDASGLEWRVHQVERQAGSGARSAYLPEGWQHGWLLFESDAEKRRLAPVPDGWRTLDAAGLQALLGDAVQARPSRWEDRPPRPRVVRREARPTAPSAAPAEAASPDPQPAPAPRPARWTVLVVDDDAADRLALRRALAELPVAVAEAESGEQAIALARDLAPHLVVLDYRLPDMTGGAVLDRLRSEPRTGHIPVLWCSANDRALDLDPRTRRAVGRVDKERFDPEAVRRQVLAALGAGGLTREA